MCEWYCPSVSDDTDHCFPVSATCFETASLFQPVVSRNQLNTIHTVFNFLVLQQNENESAAVLPAQCRPFDIVVVAELCC